MGAVRIIALFLVWVFAAGVAVMVETIAERTWLGPWLAKTFLDQRFKEISVRIDRLMHPTGKCTCHGEGECEWCQKLCDKCGGTGTKKV